MYEVATFCSLRPLGTLHFVPVASVPPLLALWLFHTLAMIGIGYGGAFTVFSPTTAAFLNAHCGPLARVFVLYVFALVVLACSYACVCWYVYDRLLERMAANEELHRQLSSFAVSNLNCAVESDRPIVETQIKRLFRSTAKFEELLHERVAPMLAQTEITGLPYELVLLAVSPHIWAGVESLALLDVADPAWLNCATLYTSVIFTSDFLGLIVMRHTAKYLKGSNRRLGIAVSTFAYAAINALSIALGPTLPGKLGLSLSVGLAVLSAVLMKLQKVAPPQEDNGESRDKLA